MSRTGKVSAGSAFSVISLVSPPGACACRGKEDISRVEGSATRAVRVSSLVRRITLAEVLRAFP
eukprot:944081-Prorocentrum_minimum.AAC.1